MSQTADKVEKTVEELVAHYRCVSCSWPGRIKFVTDRLAWGHSRRERHDVEKTVVSRTRWSRPPEPEEEP